MSERFDEMIRRSPRARASADFTERVMSRIGSREPRRSSSTWRPAFAAAAMVVVSILSGVAYEKHREAERVEAIRAEAQQLEAELDAIRKQSAEASEVYLGGDGTREYVLDLRDLTAPSSQAQTVSHQY